jgi:hypothetical protein
MSTYATKSAGILGATSKLHTATEVRLLGGSDLTVEYRPQACTESGQALISSFDLMVLFVDRALSFFAYSFSLSRAFQCPTCAVEGSRIYCKDHKQEQHIHINDQFGPKSRRNPATKGKRGKARKTSVAAEAQSTCDSSQGVNGTGQHGHRDDDVESLDEEEEVVGLGLGSGGETR